MDTDAAPVEVVTETAEVDQVPESGDVEANKPGEGPEELGDTEGKRETTEKGEGVDTQVEEAQEDVKGQQVEGEIITTEHVEGEHVEREHIEAAEGDNVEGKEIEGEQAVGEQTEGEHVEGEQTEVEQTEGEQTDFEQTEGEQTEGEQTEGEQTEGEQTEGEQTEGEQTEGEQTEDEQKVLGEGEELIEGEQAEVMKEATPFEEMVEEEEVYVEEPPPDPAAPYNFRDSLELLKEPYELRPDQLAEVEQLWELYQNYNPAYTDLDGYITEKELIYMLKCLILMTYTPEQLQELIEFCVRPPHPEGHITYEQFLKIVTLRQRDMPVEEELRSALQILDPEKTGLIDRDYFRDVLGRLGNKMPPKQLEYLIKEVDISNDGTVGIEDIVGTMCIDLNREDIIMLRQSLFPDEARRRGDDDDDEDEG